ncbi:MAG: 2-hydroxyacid dehydrogenase [Pikeienuella sp.]
MTETPSVVFCGKPEQRAAYERHLRAAMTAQKVALALHMDPAEADPATVDYLIYAANGPVTEFAPYTRLKGILNLWAGVEAVLALDPPRDVPLARMVEPGLTLGMVDYVVGHVTRHHLDIDRYIGGPVMTEWEATYPPLARDRVVGILGLGELGTACGTALAQLGFKVMGWSRSPKSALGVDCQHGPRGLEAVLRAAEILVLLLPHTPETERVLDAAALAQLPEGACVINAGRGPLIDHGALLAALDSGRLRHATMDVFDIEPLPAEDRYWTHPKVTVTPHIASVTRPETAAEALVANIARHLRGEPLIGVVDRDRGY